MLNYGIENPNPWASIATTIALLRCEPFRLGVRTAIPPQRRLDVHLGDTGPFSHLDVLALFTRPAILGAWTFQILKRKRWNMTQSS
jgi:hypothetical protein